MIEEQTPPFLDMQSEDQPAEGQESQHDFPASPKRSGVGSLVNRSTILMGLMFLVGIGWVVFASKHLEPSPAGASDPKQEVVVQAGLATVQQVAADPNGLDQPTRQRIRSMRAGMENRQIPLAPDDGDPFWGKPPEPVVEETTTPDVLPPITIVKQEPEPPSLEQLRLEGTLIGKHSSATISGVLCEVGDTLNGWEIVEISHRRVLLQWRNKKHVLQIP